MVNNIVYLSQCIKNTIILTCNNIKISDILFLFFFLSLQNLAYSLHL